MEANFYDGSIIGGREEQQDHKTNLILSERYRLYVLADGMGGQRAGGLAAATVCTAFREHLQAQPRDLDMSDPPELLRQGMEQGNRALGDILRAQPELQGMGTTLVAVLMDEATNAFSFISVGDSPLFCLRDGRLVRINANHAYREYLDSQVRDGAMTVEEAADHPNRHAVTSALMGGRIEEVDEKSDRLLPGELLLMASDGIHTLSDQEIEDILKREGRDVEKAVTALLDAVKAHKAPYQDNTTLILIQSAPHDEQAYPGPGAPSTTKNLPPTLNLGGKESGKPEIASEPEESNRSAGPERGNGALPGRKSRNLFVLPAILLIVALAGGAWWWIAHRASEPVDAVSPEATVDHSREPEPAPALPSDKPGHEENGHEENGQKQGDTRDGTHEAEGDTGSVTDDKKAGHGRSGS